MKLLLKLVLPLYYILSFILLGRDGSKLPKSPSGSYVQVRSHISASTHVFKSPAGSYVWWDLL
jgi:hypothetical protein